MSFRSRRYVSTDKHQVHPLIRLWLLRLLVPLECHRKFVGDRGLDSEELAELLGLTTEEQDSYDPLKIRAQLKQLHADAEKKATSIAIPEPLASNIEKLADIGLSHVECWILAFAICMRSNRLLDDTADWLGHEINSLTVYHVLSTLLGFPEKEIRDALSSQSLLSKTSLVVLDHQRNTLGRKLDLLSHNFADRLMAESGSPMVWLRDMIVASPSAALSLDDYPHMRETLDFVLPYLKQAVGNHRKGVNIFLYGTPGTGKTQLTRVLAQQLDCPLFEIACEDDDGDPVTGEQRLRAYRAAQAFFQKQSCLMVFDEVEDVFNDGNNLFGSKSTAQIRKAWMNRLLEENQVPTFWLGNTIDSIDPAFIRPASWPESRDFFVFLAGPDKSLPAESAFSLAHYDHVCEKFGDPGQLDRYQTFFLDSITQLSRQCFAWCKNQPGATSDRSGKPDLRAAYGLLGQEMISALTQLNRK